MGQGKGLRGHDVTTSSQRLSKKKKRGSGWQPSLSFNLEPVGARFYGWPIHIG